MNKQEFKSLIESKIVFLDGATGSNLQKRGMPVGVCPELWMLENSDTVIELQKEFLMAGTDILFAPTFTANRIKLKEYGYDDKLEAFNQGLIQISREAVKRYQSETGNLRRTYIAADITMTGQQVYPVGTLSFEELVEVYKEQVKAVLSEGVDLFVIETMMSLQECRAALLAVKELCDLPVMVSLTFTESGRTFYGTDPKTAIIVLQAMGADAVGVNCSTGPDRMLEVIREMKQYANIPIMAKPNAGIPKLIDGQTVFPMEAEEFSQEMEMLVNEGANLVGGCCGSTPRHIKLLVDKVRYLTPILPNEKHVRALTNERNTTFIDTDGRFMIIGERINPTGKKKLQEELRKGSLELVADMAIEQVQLGADILDINVGMNGIDEQQMMLEVMEEVLRVTDVPLCLDSSSAEVLEAVLRVYPGRALINSISLEKVKFEKLIPIAKKYGAMFILLPLSDKGLPNGMTEKKDIISQILARAYELGLTGEDIIIDGLVTTVGANPNAALEVIETIKYCKNELGIATTIGLSNISYGLPERQYINSTFLAFAMQAGLTMAIANPAQELLMNTALASDLLLGREDAAIRYIERVRTQAVIGDSRQHANNSGITPNKDGNNKDVNNKDVNSKDINNKDINNKDINNIDINNKEGTNIEGTNKEGHNYGNSKNVKLVSGNIAEAAANNRMANNQEVIDNTIEASIRSDVYNAVLKGNRRSIVSLIEALLNEKAVAEDILEDILIPAIGEVGILFDRQIYFLPQLIASAEAMKIAVDYLEPMFKKDDNKKVAGTIVIGTVAGDIHDIGKNLVALMLKNYGYRVIDLGKDVSTDKLLATAKKEGADIIALSALMTTTMVEMKKVVKLVKESGLKCKVIIGGAAVSQSYADEIGADGYSSDAGSAVNLVKKLLSK